MPRSNEPYKDKIDTYCSQSINCSPTYLLDALAKKVLIELDIGKKRVVRSVTGQSLSRVGDDALQEISLLTVHYLRDQKAAARVPLTDHLREAPVRVHEARADLQEISQNGNYRKVDARPCPRSLCS